MMKFLFVLGPVKIIFFILVFIVILLGRYYFFEKIGIDGKKGLIPIYSTYLYFKKGNTLPWLSTIFIFLYLFGWFLGKCSFNIRELYSIIVFLKTSILILSLFVFGKANYYIARKFKGRIILTLALTFLPIISTSYIGLNKKMRWSRLTKVNYKFLLDDFYGNRKVTLYEMFLSNIFVILALVISLYIFIYVIVCFSSIEAIIQIIFDPYFVVFLVIFLSLLVLACTLTDYIFNKKLVSKFVKK